MDQLVIAWIICWSFHFTKQHKENDYIELGQLGAYGLTFRTEFNGFSDNIYEVEDDPIMTMYGKETNKEFLVA